MRIGRGEEEIEVKITINGEEVEQVKSFCYLGSVITTDARCHKDIKRRIALGKEAFTNRGELMKGGLSKNLKKRFLKHWCGVWYSMGRRPGQSGRRISRGWRLGRCGYGAEWRRGVGGSICRMRRYNKEKKK